MKWCTLMLIFIMGISELIAFKDKRSWLSGLYQKIFFDLVARYAPRNSIR